MNKNDFEILFNEAVNGMAFVNTQGEWLHVNQSFCNMLGYTKEEILKINFQSMTHPDDLQEDIEWIEASFAGKTSHLEREKRYIRKDGSIIWIDFKVTLCRNEDQSPRYFITQIADISRRKEVEVQNERIHLRLKQVMDAAVDAIIMANSHGVIESFNKGAENMFGYNVDEALGQPVSILMEQKEGHVHQNHIDHFMKSARSEIIGMSRELKGRKQDGSVFPIKLSLSSTKSEGETFFVAVIHDISDLKNTQQEMLDQKFAAEEASQAKSEFLSNMSHELRTPLNAILGFAQLMQIDKNEKLSKHQGSQIDQILSSGRHLLNLVNEILDLTRIETGRQEFQFSVVNVKDLLNRTITSLKPLLLEKELNFHQKIKNGEPTIWVDEQKAFQAIVNIVANAIKYNKEKGWIEIYYSDLDNGFGRIAIKDSGEGIHTKDFERVFMPFERFSNKGAQVIGSGVGLTLTKSLVENMGGRIGFESELGKGSTFWIDFPTKEIKQS